MHAMIPLPGGGWQSTSTDGSDGLSSSLELAKQRGTLPLDLEGRVAVLCTKQPKYDELVKAHTLDFNGRVTETSVKNFQLVAWERKGGDLLMQFGKMSSDTFALDFAYPLTVHTAFAIALASIDTKLCYTV